MLIIVIVVVSPHAPRLRSLSLRQVHGRHQCGGHNPLYTFGLVYFLGPIAALIVTQGTL
jgi:hypothetical protein